MSLIPDIEIDIDDSKAQATLNKLDAEGRRAYRAFATNMRRSAEIGLAFTEAFGYNIDAVLRLSIETGLRTIEFIVAAATVESVATLGASQIVRFGAQAGAIALMVAQIHALTTQRQESARQLAFATVGLRAFTF